MGASRPWNRALCSIAPEPQSPTKLQDKNSNFNSLNRQVAVVARLAALAARKPWRLESLAERGVECFWLWIPETGGVYARRTAARVHRAYVILILARRAIKIHRGSTLTARESARTRSQLPGTVCRRTSCCHTKLAFPWAHMISIDVLDSESRLEVCGRL